MNGDFLCSLLGKCARSSEIDTLLRGLQPRQRPRKRCPASEYYSDELDYPSIGLRLTFGDAARHQNHERNLWTHEGVVFSQIEFFSGQTYFQRYAATLPFGLSWQDSRDTATKKLLAIQPKDARHYTRSVFTYAEYEVSIGFTGDLLSEVSCFAVPEKLSPLWTEPSPSMETLGPLLGYPAVELHKLGEWGKRTKQALSDHEDGNTLDLRFECGAEIYIQSESSSHLNSDSQPIIRGLKFYRDRELDSAEWRSNLPLGLTWDTSPSHLYKLSPEHLVEYRDDEFDGYVFWQFAEYECHIYYSNWINRLSRITVGVRGFLC